MTNDVSKEYQFADEIIRDNQAIEQLYAELRRLTEAWRNDYLSDDAFEAKVREIVNKAMDSFGLPGILKLLKAAVSVDWSESVEIPKSRRAVDWSI